MVPSQPLMDIDQDQHPVKAELDTDNGIILPKTNVIGSSYTAKLEETVQERSTPLDEQSKPKDSEDEEVNIITCKNIDDIAAADSVDPDATEYSSSFGNTLSDTEKCSGLSENEVESKFFDDSDLASPYDTLSSIFQTRKKKLTNHWRNFIRPLMWRCKWTELKLREINLQALKYSREITANEQRKHSENCQSALDGFSSKSLPFSNQCYRRRAAKRRKRKKIEETTDPTSFMLQHSLFSYLESKKSNPDNSSMIDDVENTAAAKQNPEFNDKFGTDHDQLSFEFNNNNNNNSLEQVLQKIEIAQIRLQKLKNQLDSVIEKIPPKFSSYENLSQLAQTSSAPSLTFSAEAMSAGAMDNTTNNMSEFDLDNLMIPDSAVSSFGEVPDIIESTVGMLSAADITFHQPLSGDSCEDILDNVLINNEAAAEGEEHGLLGASIQDSEKNQEPDKDEEGESANPGDLMGKSSIEAQGQTVLKSCLESDFQFPRNKRKRGERKAGSVGWNKKSSGEPDSQ